MAIDVTIEKGARRVFARAVGWPGWTRSARDEAGALEALIAYAPRYAKVAGRPFTIPKSISDLRVVERTKGDAGTDFGAPSIETASDRLPPDGAELKRLVRLLRACWAAFDKAAVGAQGVTLTTGPRGGGRTVDAMRAHVLEAERAYLSMLGGKAPKAAAGAMRTMRKAMTDMLAARVRGETPEPSPRRRKPFWSPRFTIHRSAWHALDHAWEIEDRARL